MGTAGYCRLRRNAGYCGVMQGSMGYCKVLQSTAGYNRGILGGNYLGTVEYCKYWAELGGGYSTGSALQYPEVPCKTPQYPEVSPSSGKPAFT